MSGHYYHRIYHKQIAAWLALFAIALIIVAPLISVSLQKVTMQMMPGVMHHHMPMMDEHHVGHKPIQMPEDHAEACGYCVLLVHVPGLLSAPALLICAQMLHLRLQTPRSVIQEKFFFPWLYPHTRAPPQKTTFTYLIHKNGRFNANSSLCCL
ncbi:hypothetical protein WC1_01620 [Citrobacter sp. KTE30]|uniref:DUF2946 domain-containing protein n=1 Tax=Citrobacter sp. KTE30 TaxID=1169319 RepID=UPI00032E55AF|nr:DUF2946 domain-containing protein [Citrobacter sp. KTE30]EOQ24694.1 hypothetical protein WC1_01620 [Citrobacter sp. KTE30]